MTYQIFAMVNGKQEKVIRLGTRVSTRAFVECLIAMGFEAWYVTQGGN